MDNQSYQNLSLEDLQDRYAELEEEYMQYRNAHPTPELECYRKSVLRLIEVCCSLKISLEDALRRPKNCDKKSARKALYDYKVLGEKDWKNTGKLIYEIQYYRR